MTKGPILEAIQGRGCHSAPSVDFLSKYIEFYGYFAIEFYRTSYSSLKSVEFYRILWNSIESYGKFDKIAHTWEIP